MQQSGLYDLLSPLYTIYMTTLIRNTISVRTSTVHGRGVFADDDIAEGEVIEECHLIAIPAEIKSFDNYTFNLRTNEQPALLTHKGLAFGYGSIYNSSNQPNAIFAYDPDKSLLRVTAIANISRDDEIFINYGDKWFKSRNILPCKPSLSVRIKRFIKRNGFLFRAGLTVAAIVCILKLAS